MNFREDMIKPKTIEKTKYIVSALPMSRDDMELRGWHELDILIISGDAYVDHPSFGTALIGRVLEECGMRVGVSAQPDWRSNHDISLMGRPRLGVFVTAGNLDSMLSNYSKRGKKRRRDAYSPDGEAGHRPDRATITYCNLVRSLWGDIPLIIGGIEASLRKMAHYDYWADAVRRSILVDSRADILMYGMAEIQSREIVARLSTGRSEIDFSGICGTVWKTHDVPSGDDIVSVPSFSDVSSDKRAYAEAFRLSEREHDPSGGRRVVQDQGAWYVVVEPPARPLSTEELDAIYELPYTRNPHHSYAGHDIPALSEVKFSVVSHRGCFGACSFCAISSHQGKTIQARSEASIEREVRLLTTLPDFKGYIHDVGGPSANFRDPSCEKSVRYGACTDRACMYPEPCPHIKASHSSSLSLLSRLRKIDGIKKIFIRSGIRYDYILAARDGKRYVDEICKHHVSGQLKIAPEHVSCSVLAAMGKGSRDITLRFIEMWKRANEKLGKKQFLVPYFMSSHPGCTLKDAVELAEFIRDIGIRPEQAQDFTPTPGSVSTCMYYTGIDPRNGSEIYVPRDTEERAMQRALLQYWMPHNRDVVRAALIKAGRRDLIGTGKKCLIR